MPAQFSINLTSSCINALVPTDKDKVTDAVSPRDTVSLESHDSAGIDIFLRYTGLSLYIYIYYRYTASIYIIL